MKTLEKLYWLRLALGITAALICIVYGLATNTISKETAPIDTFINGLSIALITYVVSYYVIKKAGLIKKVESNSEKETPRKLMTTGIGIYIISWIVFWTLIYTIIAETTG